MPTSRKRLISILRDCGDYLTCNECKHHKWCPGLQNFDYEVADLLEKDEKKMSELKTEKSRLEDVIAKLGARAAPVRHGQWIGHTGQPGSGFIIGATYYTCSLCGRVEEENGEPYCHCGAKMGVEERDVYGGAK